VASTFATGVPTGVGVGEATGLEADGEGAGVVSEGLGAGVAPGRMKGTSGVSAAPRVLAGRLKDCVGSAMLTRVKMLMIVGGGTITTTVGGLNPGHAVPV
jgi:hypothetical protein